jgi:hypothetical protein
MRPVLHSEGLPVPKPPENLTFSDDTLILMKIADSKKETMLIPIRHLKQVVPHLNQTRIFLPWQAIPRNFSMLTDYSGGHLEEMFQRHNLAEIRPLLFLGKV